MKWTLIFLAAPLAAGCCGQPPGRPAVDPFVGRQTVPAPPTGTITPQAGAPGTLQPIPQGGLSSPAPMSPGAAPPTFSPSPAAAAPVGRPYPAGAYPGSTGAGAGGYPSGTGAGGYPSGTGTGAGGYPSGTGTGGAPAPTGGSNLYAPPNGNWTSPDPRNTTSTAPAGAPTAMLTSAPATTPGDVVSIPVSNDSSSRADSFQRPNIAETAAAAPAAQQPVVRTLQPRPKAAARPTGGDTGPTSAPAAFEPSGSVRDLADLPDAGSEPK